MSEVPLDHMRWAARCRAELVARGQTLEWLEGEAGLPAGYATKILSGQKSPTFRTMDKVNRVLLIELRADVLEYVDAAWRSSAVSRL